MQQQHNNKTTCGKCGKEKPSSSIHRDALAIDFASGGKIVVFCKPCVKKAQNRCIKSAATAEKNARIWENCTLANAMTHAKAWRKRAEMLLHRATQPSLAITRGIK